ncbi:uncharacterized protein LOC121656406 [Xyrichtys novacula]|uniref:Uncharacterized protein LOC121656406 n=1 Tax=Xyrichtys novacula TaxID=13765 RepID=A0AAV1G038_XYRNO|nr:uncharacterized protein LOC121656406 [Xyrichtys novacula]
MPAKTQVHAGGGVEAPVSSTPCQPELWSIACRDKHHAVPPSTLSSPPTIPMTSRFDVLSKEDFPPLGENAQQQQAVKPSSIHRKLLKEAVAQRSSGSNTNPVTTGPSAAGKRCFSGLQSTLEPSSPSPTQKCVHEGLAQSPAFSRALHGGLLHLKAILDDSVVAHVGSNDLHLQQSEKLRNDFIQLIDSILDVGKQCVISGPFPSPRFGDVKFSRSQQLHIWLKDYCCNRGIPYVDNFTTFYTRTDLFKHDRLHPNYTRSRLLSLNIDLTLHSCKAFSASTIP